MYSLTSLDAHFSTVKCFTDIRSEKCYQKRLSPNTYKWNPGYSAHGTHCWSLHFIHLSKTKRQKFGFVDFKGVPISNNNIGGHCTQEYTIKITKTKEGSFDNYKLSLNS